jgi:hypothetical protein
MGAVRAVVLNSDHGLGGAGGRGRSLACRGRFREQESRCSSIA